MRDGAVAAYARLEAELGADAERAIWGAWSTIIDANGAITGEVRPDPKLWRDASLDERLSRAVGHPVRSLPAATVLRRSLALLRSPLPFATTCYPRSLHDQVGGYSGGRLINPDKWFLWKVLGAADTVYVIEHPLFDYRVHDAGQGPQEQRSGALKHLTDQYVATFNLPDSVLAKAGLDREAIAKAFVEQDIALRGFVSLAEGKRRTALRGIRFGLAAYPELVRSNPKVWLLRALLLLGPAGTSLARAVRRKAQDRWQARASRTQAS
jgi:hypothetical protein